MIFWLGDNPGHHIYMQEKSTQAAYFEYVANLFLKYNYSGKVYAVLGNHDCFPPSQFDIYDDTDRWLTEKFANILSNWYSSDAIKTMREHGYFAELYKNTKLKIIGLNTQATDFANLYLMGNSTDPLRQIEWLEKELKSSEERGESVMILGHVGSQSKSGTNCKIIIENSMVL